MKKLFNMDAKKRNIIVASILGVTIGGLSMFGLNHKNKELVQKEKSDSPRRSLSEAFAGISYRS